MTNSNNFIFKRLKQCLRYVLEGKWFFIINFLSSTKFLFRKLFIYLSLLYYFILLLVFVSPFHIFFGFVETIIYGKNQKFPSLRQERGELLTTFSFVCCRVVGACAHPAPESIPFTLSPVIYLRYRKICQLITKLFLNYNKCSLTKLFQQRESSTTQNIRPKLVLPLVPSILCTFLFMGNAMIPSIRTYTL